MALLRKVPTAAFLLAASLVLAACSSGSGGGCDGDDDDGAGCSLRRSLIGCAPPPPPPPAEAAGDGTAGRAALAPLQSAAAATGFASLRSPGADRARAFGLCFGELPDACLACLSAAAAAVTEGCGNGTRRGAAWRDGCLLAYSAADDDGSEGGAFPFLAGGDARDQALADIVGALAESKGQSLWRKALSVLFYALAAVGAVSVVLLLCLVIAACMLAETLVRNSAAGYAAAGAGRRQAGEGITAYVVATNGQSPLWSVATQIRLY